MTAPHRVHMEDVRPGRTHAVKLFAPGPDGKPEAIKFYFTVSRLSNGAIGEVFIRCDRQGSLMSGVLDALGIMISLALQHGVGVDVLVEKMKGTRFPPDHVPHFTSVLDYLAKLLEGLAKVAV